MKNGLQYRESGFSLWLQAVFAHSILFLISYLLSLISYLSMVQSYQWTYVSPSMVSRSFSRKRSLHLPEGIPL